MGGRREEEGAAPRDIWCGFCPLQDDVFPFASPVAMVSVPVFITESVRAHRALEKLFCSEREPRAAQEAPGSGWEGRGSGRPCSRSAAALPEPSRRLPRGSFPACHAHGPFSVWRAPSPFRLVAVAGPDSSAWQLSPPSKVAPRAEPVCSRHSVRGAHVRRLHIGFGGLVSLPQPAPEALRRRAALRLRSHFAWMRGELAVLGVASRGSPSIPDRRARRCR